MFIYIKKVFLKLFFNFLLIFNLNYNKFSKFNLFFSFIIDFYISFIRLFIV